MSDFVKEMAWLMVKAVALSGFFFVVLAGVIVLSAWIDG
jgi:hypothetical protein